jgi:hypothetical protein
MDKYGCILFTGVPFPVFPTIEVFMVVFAAALEYSLSNVLVSAGKFPVGEF